MFNIKLYVVRQMIALTLRREEKARRRMLESRARLARLEAVAEGLEFDRAVDGYLAG